MKKPLIYQGLFYAHQEISLHRETVRVAAWTSKKSTKPYFKKTSGSSPEVFLCVNPKNRTAIICPQH
ncbi:hypothetical protein [Pseudochrobactrum asaccharolyticum]|uniref:hypothetical protein n=1 Tax=Pseudochrobactrum asaccharolyticum TaxID=354351 RepID=UPI001AECF017|nr:hypothetical protein [Pseudochrobactrum asaccharolyticum]